MSHAICPPVVICIYTSRYRQLHSANGHFQFQINFAYRVHHQRMSTASPLVKQREQATNPDDPLVPVQSGLRLLSVCAQWLPIGRGDRTVPHWTGTKWRTRVLLICAASFVA